MENVHILLCCLSSQYLDVWQNYTASITNAKKRQDENMIRMFIQRCQLNALLAVSLSDTVNRNLWVQERTNSFWEKDVSRMNEVKFKENFRMSKHSFRNLCGKLGSFAKRDTKFRKAIPLDKRVAIALYALGSSAEYRSIANLFGVGRTTVGKIVVEFCDSVWAALKAEYLAFFNNLNQETLQACIDGFDQLGFPQCFGAIDGCHIEVRPPKAEAFDYYNFKGWHSTILLAVVDYRYRFTYINVGAPGRMRDCTLYDISMLKKLQKSNPIFGEVAKAIHSCSVPPVLIGDSAFALTERLMKPFPYKSDLTLRQQIFNKKLSSARRVVENAFGHVKARFRKVGRGLEVNIENTKKIIKAVCLLHNFLNEQNDRINQTWIREMKAFEQAKQRQTPEQSTVQEESNAANVRNVLARFIFERNQHLYSDLRGALIDPGMGDLALDAPGVGDCTLDSPGVGDLTLDGPGIGSHAAAVDAVTGEYLA